jgi:hypothetical protein
MVKIFDTAFSVLPGWLPTYLTNSEEFILHWNMKFENKIIIVLLQNTSIR